MGVGGACAGLLVKMLYLEKVAKVFGEDAVNVILVDEAVDDGGITMDQGHDIARKLNSSGKLRQRRNSFNNFEFDIGAKWAILDYY